MKTKTGTPLGTFAAPAASEGNDASPASARGLARFGLKLDAVKDGYWHPPDARERPDPVRIVDVGYWYDGSGEKRYKTLPSGKQAQVLAVFFLERKAGGKRTWECLSSRAIAAVNDLEDPSQWFSIRGKGTGTDKEFSAKPWSDADERDD